MRQVTIGQDKSDWMGGSIFRMGGSIFRMGGSIFRMGGVCPCLQKFPQTDFVRGNGEKRLSGDGAGYT